MADESIPRVLCRHPCLHVLDSSVSRSCISRRQCGTPHRRQRLGRRAGAHGPVALPVRRPRKDLHDHVGLDDHGRPERSGGDPSLSSARRNCRSRSRVGLISSRTGQQSVIWVFLTVADTREVILMNAAAAVVEPSLDAATETRLGRLRWWNVGVGLILAAQAVVIALLANDFSLPVVATYMAGPPGTEPVLTKLFDLPLGWGVFAFMAISAAALLIIASPGVFQWYKGNLLKGRNYGRWIEYSISSSIMIVLIAMICGISGIASTKCPGAVRSAGRDTQGPPLRSIKSTPQASRYGPIVAASVGVMPGTGVSSAPSRYIRSPGPNSRLTASRVSRIRRSRCSRLPL